MTTKEKIKTGALGVFSTIILSTGIYSLVLRPDGTEYTQDDCPYFWETSEGFCYTKMEAVQDKIKEKAKTINNTNDSNVFIELCKKEKNDKCKEVTDKIKAKYKNDEKLSANELKTYLRLKGKTTIQDFSDISQIFND